MYNTYEEYKKNQNHINKFRQQIKQQIGQALAEERLKRRLPLSEVSKATGIPIDKIELAELARKKEHNSILFKLLQYYRKNFKIILTDINKPTV